MGAVKRATDARTSNMGVDRDAERATLWAGLMTVLAQPIPRYDLDDFIQRRARNEPVRRDDYTRMGIKT